MHLQNFVYLLLVASVFEYTYEANSSDSTSNKNDTIKDEWDWDKNYRYNDNDNSDNYYGNKQSNNDDDNYNSKGKKSSNKDDDDYNSKGKKSSYKDDDDYNSKGNKQSYKDDDDYKSKGKKPSYKDDDDYNSKGKKQSYKDDDDDYGSRGNRPSYNDDEDDYDRDYKPSKYPSRRRKSPDDIGNINIYMREPSRDGRKRKPKRMRFPVARYERGRFPSFGPLISFLPWLPIFTDRLTKQTFIYSPTGGIYIIPPVINFYGDLISIAELIASGYASLVSTGAPPPPAFNVAPHVQPGPVVGPSIPPISPVTGGFKGGVATKFRFTPRANYPTDIEEDPVPDPPSKDQGYSYSNKDYSGSQKSDSGYGGGSAAKAY